MKVCLSWSKLIFAIYVLKHEFLMQLEFCHCRRDLPSFYEIFIDPESIAGFQTIFEKVYETIHVSFISLSDRGQ